MSNQFEAYAVFFRHESEKETIQFSSAFFYKALAEKARDDLMEEINCNAWVEKIYFNCASQKEKS